MAFMVPLVKNHYDIYARNNPADHVDGGATAAVNNHNNSLYLSATSLGKNGAKPLTKQYRIVISGGKVVGGAKQAANKKQPSANKPSLAQAPGGGKLYYRMPSASISLPVVPRKPVNQKVAQKSEPSSPQSVSPPSRPLPHVRRTVRNPMTNRVYSYSVSIPDYVAEEDEEEDEEDEEDDLDDLDIDLGNDDDDETEEDKENLLLFSTSAPAGTGPIAQAQTPSPPPIQPKKKNAKKLQQTLSTPNSPDHQQGQIISSGRQPHSRTLSSTSTTSTTTTTSSNTTNSREYVELLRKFILHLKMLKIGGGNKKRRSAKNNNNPSDDLIVNQQANAQQLRPRKRKDTMEDSNHL